MNKEISPESYDKFCQFIYSKSGILLGDAKQYLVRSRLVPLMHEFASAHIDTLVNDVISQRNPKLTQAALEAMTTNETLWFRDKYPFEILRTAILPELAKKQKKLRIWSAASSTGQEAYSIAMTIAEFVNGNRSAFAQGVEIVGTDLSSEVIQTARTGTYDTLSLNRGLSDDVKNRYFMLNEDKSMTVKPEIKKWVNFREFNLTSSFAALGKFDIVFCRNVLIYFNGNEKVNILNKIAACLNPGGSLFLGAAESIGGAEHLFKVRTGHEGLYYTRL